METNQLQQAIQAIKAGDRQTGQRLLAEILKQEPQNESAWLWMSTLVSGDQRKLCLQKALSINPNNAQAREQLERLSTPPAAQVQTTAEPERVVTEPPAAAAPPVPVQAQSAMAQLAANMTAPNQKTFGDQFWVTPRKYVTTFVYMSGDTFLSFDVAPEKAAQMVSEIRAGTSPKQLHADRSTYRLEDVCYLLFGMIKTVTLFGESLKIVAADAKGNEKTFNINCNKENKVAILDALQTRLDPAFKRSSKPISRARVLISAAILLLLSVCGTGFFYWFVNGLAQEEVSGSARARGIANLLLLIGPNGFLCIGGLITVVVVIALISSLAKPPEETILSRNAG